MRSLGDINPPTPPTRPHAPTAQRSHLLTAKASTNGAFQMNPAPCVAERRKPRTFCFALVEGRDPGRDPPSSDPMKGGFPRGSRDLA